MTVAVENPLLHLWESCFGKWRGKNWDYDTRSDDRHWDARKDAVQQYAWAVPTEEALDVLSEHAPLVEVGAGSGYWA